MDKRKLGKLRKLCLVLLQRTKKDYFQNLNAEDLSDKKFWKTIKPYFSIKVLNSNKMLLKGKGELIADEKQLASIVNKFFINITKCFKSYNKSFNKEFQQVTEEHVY